MTRAYIGGFSGSRDLDFRSEQKEFVQIARPQIRRGPIREVAKESAAGKLVRAGTRLM